MLSFWERTSLTHADYLIVGSGIVGLSTAATLLEQQPNASVTIVERGILPTGASTKNAGFACFGSVTELLDDLKTATPEQVATLVEKRWKGIQQLRQRLGDHAIGFAPNGGFELLLEPNETALAHIDTLNQLLSPIFGNRVFTQEDARIESFGFRKERTHHLITNHFEAGIDTGKMMHALMQFVTERGGKILTGTTLHEFEELPNGIKATLQGNSGSTLAWHCKKLLFCTNAFSKQFFPHLDITPGRGQVLVTKPIEKLKIKGVFHFEEGYFYFRDIGNRLIFGGGRNRDLPTETTDSFGENATILQLLKHYLADFILPETPHEIDYYWSGIMAFGTQKTPIVEQVGKHTWIAVRLGGMGVAIGTSVGAQLAEKVLAPNG